LNQGGADIGMSDQQVFISYPHVERAAVDMLVGRIEASGVSVWYSGRMGTGDFANQIHERIHSCTGMVVILTEEGTKPKSREWIQTEMQILADAGMKDRMLPCIIGDFVMPVHYLSAIINSHQVSSPDIGSLCNNPDFLARLDAFRAPGARVVRQTASAPDAETPETWLDSGPDVASLALALASAMLEYCSTDAVFAAADQIEVLIDAQLRPLSRKEQKAQPRALGRQGRGARLKAVHAARVVLRNGTFDLAFEGVRFANPNWRTELLWQVWSDREDIREILIDWCQQVLGASPPAAERQRLMLALGLIAQQGFASVHDGLLLSWLQSPLRDARLFAVSDVMGHAIAEKGNALAIERILLRMAKAEGRSQGARDQRRAALAIALGPTGLRRPEIGIKVLRAIGREAFLDHKMMRTALTSPLFFGSKTSAEVAAGLKLDDSEKDAEKDTDESEAEQEPDGADTAGGKQEPAERDISVQTLTAAGFLAALADWAQEYGTDKQGEFDRQLPLHALMTAFERMPLLTRPDSTQLTLQDLVNTVAQRDPVTIQRILQGFVAAAAARPVLDVSYIAPRQMQNVFRMFAAERAAEKKARNGKSKEAYPEPDPYLSFAGWVRRALDDAGSPKAGWIISGSERFLSQADKDAIIAGGGLVALPSEGRS